MTEIFILLGLAKIPPRKSLLESDLTDGPCEKEMLFVRESSLVPLLLCHCCGHCMSWCEIPDAPRLAGWPRGVVATGGTGHVSDSMARISHTQAQCEWMGSLNMWGWCKHLWLSTSLSLTAGFAAILLPFFLMRFFFSTVSSYCSPTSEIIRENYFRPVPSGTGSGVQIFFQENLLKLHKIGGSFLY